MRHRDGKGLTALMKHKTAPPVYLDCLRAFVAPIIFCIAYSFNTS